jgi:hypothetical protein
MRMLTAKQATDEAFARARRVIAKKGEPLSTPARFGRFTHAFGSVQVHHDAEAAASAQAFATPAYAFGAHVVLARPPEAMPHDVLAHELGHVASSNAAEPASPQRIGRRDSPAELAAATVVRGGVPAAVRTMPGTVHRFGSEEHRSLGADASVNALTDVDISNTATPEYLTYGEMVALAGDYFGSLDEIRNLAATAGGRDRIRWTKWKALDQYKGVAEPALPETKKKEVNDQYFELAAKNISHFSAGGTASATYGAQHELALAAGFMEGYNASLAVGGGPRAPDTAPAMTQEAFAQHFLSDMFAAGHVRTERAAIKAWYDAHMPNSTEQFITYMGHYMHAYFVREHPIGDFFGKVPSESDIKTSIKQIGGKALDAFSLGDIVSLGWHDQDNAGLDVVSDVDERGAGPGGQKWVDVGDNHLASSPKTRAMAVAAMKASIADVNAAIAAGKKAGQSAVPVSTPGGGGPSAALQAAIAGLKPYQALRYIPRVDPSSTTNLPMLWQWGSMNQWMYSAIDTAVKGDVADQLDKIADKQTDANKNAGLKDFVALLKTLGIRALEQAIGTPAR